MTISEFIERCDAYIEVSGRKRVWLSKRLFDDTYRLDHLAAGTSDVGVMRLEKAVSDLAELERERAGAPEVAKSDQDAA